MKTKKEEFNQLLDEYNNRGISSSSNKNLIIAKLKSFKEVISIFAGDKSSSIPLLKEAMSSSDISKKTVACVLFKGIAKEEIKEMIEIYPISKYAEGLSIENYADYFVKCMGDNMKTEHSEHIEDYNF
jgi:hypothetical protein